jgi:16S rRNA processing protein RimM
MERTTAEPVRGSFPGSQSWVEVGQIVRAHGLDGTLLVQLYGDDPGNLIDAETVQLRGAPGEVEFRICHAETTGPGGPRVRIRLSLQAIESRDSAEAWIGAKLAIHESALQGLPAGEYYWRDILGLRCRRADTGEDLGVVEEILPTAENDLLVVRAGGEPVLIPALREILTRVDLTTGEVWIDPLPGLLEEGP